MGFSKYSRANFILYVYYLPLVDTNKDIEYYSNKLKEYI